MNRWTLLAAITALVTASTAIADLPPPPGIIEVTPRVRFAGVEKYPQHVFYLKFVSTRLNPNFGTPHAFEVKNTNPITLTGTQRRIFNMQLLAMDKTEFEKRKGEDAKLAWLTDKTPGVLAAKVDAPPTFGNVKDKEVPVTEYTVNMTDGKLTVQSAPKVKGTTELAPEAPVRPWAIGIACALSLACFGVWSARRRQMVS